MTMLEAALEYARRGWPVLPLHEPAGPGCSCGREDCTSPGKHPRTIHGLEDATVRETKVKAWWLAWPSANIGLRTGIEFDVVDIDNGQALRELSRRAGDAPAFRCPAVKTGKGWHWYFEPSGLGNRAGVLPGVDFRGRGGYVVAPPSLHAEGHRYSWLRGFGDEPGETPEWLADLLDPPRLAPVRPLLPRNLSAYGQRALENECASVVNAPPGTWNNTLNRAAFALGRLVASNVLPRSAVETELYHASALRGHATTEAERTIASGLGKGLAQPRTVDSPTVLR